MVFYLCIGKSFVSLGKPSPVPEENWCSKSDEEKTEGNELNGGANSPCPLLLLTLFFSILFELVSTTLFYFIIRGSIST